MLVSFFISVLGFLLTGGQSLLIYFQGEGVCFNEGCAIVDSLTLVDPLVFNLVGCAFFLISAIGISRARKGSDLWRRFISLVLLAALAAEGVLLAFQVIISQALCSYCLIILALVLLINLFMGLKQIFKGVFIFTAVLLASFALDYHGGAIKPQPIDGGTMARYQPASAGRQIYLFISSTCKHCQSVLDALGNSAGCAVNFNPVDRYDTFSFGDAETIPGYRPEINLAFLKRLEIREVPVLLVKEDSAMTLVSGEQAVISYIERQCMDSQPAASVEGSEQVSSISALPLPSEEDGCSVEQDCQDPAEQTSQLPQ